MPRRKQSLDKSTSDKSSCAGHQHRGFCCRELRWVQRLDFQWAWHLYGTCRLDSKLDVILALAVNTYTEMLGASNMTTQDPWLTSGKLREANAIEALGM